MWVVEGKFRNLEADEQSERKRWLRPSRVYSVGRESINDLSLELPRTLGRVRGLELDVGSWLSIDEEGSSDTSKPCPLTITNYDSKTRLLFRGDEPAITIKSQASTNIQSGDEVASEASNTIRFLRFSWNPIKICCSALSVTKRASIHSDLRDAGFSFTEARFPSNEHTHFLPKPLKPTLPIGYALVEGIQLISETWLDELLLAIRLKPPPESTKSIRNAPKRKDNETDQAYEERVRLKDLLQRSRYKGFSEFETDYDATWQKLRTCHLGLPHTTPNPDFKRWLQDPIKLNPDPERKTLFSNTHAILLANQNDENSKNIEQILQAGQATISTIYTAGDQLASFSQQLQSLLSQQPISKACFFIKTPTFTGSLKNIKGQEIKTINDVLNAIYDVDVSGLIDKSSSNRSILDALIRDHQSSPDSATKHQESPPLRSLPLSANPVNITKNSTIEPENLASRDDCSSLNSQLGRRKLIRRADTRSDAVRMKELERLMGPDPCQVEGSELETLKMHAKMEDPSMDQSAVLFGARKLDDSSPAPGPREIGNENESTSNLDVPSKSASPPVKTIRKPLLKRKARDQDALNIDKYMPFLTGDVIETPKVVEEETLQRDTNSYSTKRQRLGDSYQAGSGSTLDTNEIEGPVTKMLKATAVQTQNELKRKAFVGLSADEEVGPSQETAKQKRKGKRGRIDEQTPMDEPGTDSSNPQVTQVTNDPVAKRKGLQSGTKKRSESCQDDPKQLSHESEGDSNNLYLTVKTTGKRLTAEEIESNLEFNRLQISKVPTLLKTKPIPTRRIEWNEEDQSENELREMDGWNLEKAHGTSTKSFFKVKYVNLVKRPPQSSWQDSVDETGSINDHLPNFKKFKSKNRRLGQMSATSFQPCQPRNTIRMETVRLNESATERERSKAARQPSSTRVSKEFEDEAEEEIQLHENIRKGKKQQVGRAIKSAKSQATTSRNRHDDSDSSNSGSLHQQRPSSFVKKDQAELFSRSTFLDSDSDDKAMPSKQPTGAGSKPSIRSTQNRAQTQTTQATRSKRKPQKNTPSSDTESSESSDGDELAFKGFGRKR